MIIQYSNNIFKQIAGIIFFNRGSIFLILLVASFATVQYYLPDWWSFARLTLPVVPVSILGGALAIFLGFRNNSAYDRWWEARKIWGGIVNASRSFSSSVLAFGSGKYGKEVSDEEVKEWGKNVIYHHIAWLYALKMHLRKENKWEVLDKYLSEKELEELIKKHNKPAQLLHVQSMEMNSGFEQGIIEDFRHMELASLLKEFYGLQGMAERIKNTVFPYYYNYFTSVFLWLFICCLPFTLVSQMGWGAIPMSFAISFVFNILEKSGAVTEDPFESRAADTPISSIVRTIEIDMLEMLGSDVIPALEEPEIGRFGVKFIR